jgi:hypothetical protein
MKSAKKNEDRGTNRNSLGKSDHARKHERRGGPTSWAENRDPGLETETKVCTGSPLSGRKIFSKKSKTRAKKNQIKQWHMESTDLR